MKSEVYLHHYRKRKYEATNPADFPLMSLAENAKHATAVDLGL
jgi:hypothetical protein